MSQNREFQQNRRSLLGRRPSVNPWEGGAYPSTGHSGSTLTLATNLLSSVFTSPHQSSMQVPSSLSLDTRLRMGGSGHDSSSDRSLPMRGSGHYSILNKLLNMRGSVYDSSLDRRLPMEGSDSGSSLDRHLHDSSLNRHLPIGGSGYDSSLDRCLPMRGSGYDSNLDTRLRMGGSGYGSSLDRRLAVRGSGHNSVLNKLNMRGSGYDSSLNRHLPMEGSDNPVLNHLLNMRGSDNNSRRYSENSLYRPREMDVRRDPYYKDRRYASGRDIQEKKSVNQSFRSGNLEKGRSDRVTDTDKKDGEEKKGEKADIKDASQKKDEKADIKDVSQKEDEKADVKDASQKTDEDCKRDSVNAEKKTEDEQEETKKIEEVGAKADKTDGKHEFDINNFTSSAERGSLSSVETVNTGGQEEDELKRNGTDKDISKEAGKEKENRTACKRYNVPDYNPNIAVGMSLLRQITGQVCRACHKFFLNAEDAKTHCRTLMHYNKFMEVVDEKAKAAEVKSKRPADKVDEDSKRPKVASLNEEEDEAGQSNEKRLETMETTPNMLKKQKAKSRQFEAVRL